MDMKGFTIREKNVASGKYATDMTTAGKRNEV